MAELMVRGCYHIYFGIADLPLSPRCFQALRGADGKPDYVHVRYTQGRIYGVPDLCSQYPETSVPESIYGLLELYSIDDWNRPPN